VKYLFLLYSPDDGVPSDPGSAEYARTYRAYREMQDAMAEAGVLLACEPLQAASTATTVRVRDEEIILTDGPAAEIKEQVGGYVVVECADLDEALKWAAVVPAAQNGSVEVRAVVATPAPV
jgi:hypothetical protein